MKLTELDPHWIGHGGEGVTDKDGRPVPRRERVALVFDCPCGCKTPHCIHIRNPVDGGPPISPDSATWERTGEDFERLTLTPSLLIRPAPPGCRGWHGHITDGEIKNA